jgi:hypothetical protein
MAGGSGIWRCALWALVLVKALGENSAESNADSRRALSDGEAWDEALLVGASEDGESVEWGAAAKKEKFSASARRVEEGEEGGAGTEDRDRDGASGDSGVGVWQEWTSGNQVQGDTEVDCPAWADLGECVKNEAFMVDHCAESCYHQHLIRSAVLTGKPFEVQCSTTVGPFTVELHPRYDPC